MNRLAATATGSVLFCAGVLVGLAVRRTPSEPNTSPSADSARIDPASPRPQTPMPGSEAVNLEARVRELEAELSTVRTGRAKPGAGPAPSALSEEVFKGYLELHQSKNPDPEKARILFARLGQLDEKSAGYFIDQFRKSTGPDLEDEREVAMELALACGGPAVGDFVNVLLNDPSVDGDLRSDLLQELSGVVADCSQSDACRSATRSRRLR